MIESGFFGDPAYPLFGWLHTVERPASVGVLICPPLGQEATNTHRTLRAAAEAMAARGLPCLRMDLSGTGNAADRPESDDQGAWPAWQASVQEAIEHLCRRTGVARVVVVGVRGSVLVTAPVAAVHPQVAALVGLAPVASGRALVREWRALAATTALREAHDDGALEVAGVCHSAGTLQAVAAVSLPDTAWPPEKPVWLIDREDLPGATRWAGALQTQAVPLTASRVAGLADMLLEPHRHTVPHAALQTLADQVAAWARTAPVTEVAPTAARPAQDAPAPVSTRGPGAAAFEPQAQVSAGVAERVWCVDQSGCSLYGVVAEPVSPRQPHAVLLLPNTGAVHHVGNHRLYVQMARTLAAQGCVVIRFDLSGLGESPPRPGEPDNVVYGRHALDDVGVVAAAVRARWPGLPVSVLGLCAGGYQALRGAVTTPGLAQAIVINPLVFHWHEGMTLENQEPLVQEAYYRAKWRSGGSWKRLLTGRTNMRQLVRVVAGRVWRGLKRRGPLRAPTAGPTAGQGAADDLNRDLQTACGQGTRLHFVFSAGEPGWLALQAQAAASLRRLQPTGELTVHHMPRADHTFSTVSARQRLVARVAALLAPEA